MFHHSLIIKIEHNQLPKKTCCFRLREETVDISPEHKWQRPQTVPVDSLQMSPGFMRSLTASDICMLEHHLFYIQPIR